MRVNRTMGDKCYDRYSAREGSGFIAFQEGNGRRAGPGSSRVRGRSRFPAGMRMGDSSPEQHVFMNGLTLFLFNGSCIFIRGQTCGW
jgi:hypothetical protein